jgi:hypothetical protein
MLIRWMKGGPRLEREMVRKIFAVSVKARLARPQRRLEAPFHERRNAVVTCCRDRPLGGIRSQSRTIKPHLLVGPKVRECGRGARPYADLPPGVLHDLDLDEPLDQGQVELETIFLPTGEAEAPDEFEGLVGDEIRQLSDLEQLLVDAHRAAARSLRFCPGQPLIS